MSSERDALLAAICANPEDDTPRLVFADWLQENGSSEWAALIRCECELARIADDGSGAEAVFRFLRDRDNQSLKGVKWGAVDPEIARRVELMAQAKRLRPKARREMVSLIPRNAGLGWQNDTHRGFPDTLYATRKNKVDPAAIMHLPPFRLLVGYCNAEPTDAVREWVAGGLLRHMRELLVPDNRADLTPEFSTSPDVVGVRTFSHYRWTGTGSAEVCVRWLTATTNWSGLRELDIVGVLEREPAAMLFHAEHLRKLTRLRIRGSNWTRHTIRDLNHFTELRDLQLSNCGLGDDAAEVIAKMPGLAKLRSLSLPGNQITGRGATALLTSPHLANVAFLDLEQNPVRGLDAKPLASAPAAGLRALQLHGCRLTPKDVGAMATSPRVSNLVYLDLDWNRLPEPALSRLVKGLGNHAPAILYLIGNEFGAPAIRVLAAWEAARNIHMLHLRQNPLKLAAAKILASSPHLTTLRHLCTSGLGRRGVEVLRERFGKKVDV